MSFSNTGLVWTAESLRTHLQTIPRPLWCEAITFHHTASPNLAQRPSGFTAQHLRNLKYFYEKEKGWRAGPHLFVDDNQLWGMTEFRERGVHAVSFNGRSIGIEVLGDYDAEDPKTGRGLACWQNAAAAGNVILQWLGVTATVKTVWFHRDDPKTTKTCPGKKVTLPWVLELMAQAKGRTQATGAAPAQASSRPNLQGLTPR